MVMGHSRGTAAERAEALLREGEQVIWAGEPGRGSQLAQCAPLLVPIVPFAAFAYAVFTDWPSPAGESGVGFFSVFLPAVGILLGWAVWLQLRASVHRLYVVTDSRVIVDGAKQAQYLPDDLRHIRVCRHLLSRRADVLFREERYGFGETRGVKVSGFRGVDDPDAVVAALLRLKPTLAVQSEKPWTRFERWAKVVTAALFVASLANSYGDGLAWERRWTDAEGRSTYFWASSGWRTETAAVRPPKGRADRWDVMYRRRELTPFSSSQQSVNSTGLAVPSSAPAMSALVWGVRAVENAEAEARAREEEWFAAAKRLAAAARTAAEFNAAGDAYQQLALPNDALPLFERAAASEAASPRERAYALASRATSYAYKGWYRSGLREAERALAVGDCPPDIARRMVALRDRFRRYLAVHPGSPQDR